MVQLEMFFMGVVHHDASNASKLDDCLERSEKVLKDLPVSMAHEGCCIDAGLGRPVSCEVLQTDD